MAKAKQGKSPDTQDMVKNALLGMAASTSSLKEDIGDTEADKSAQIDPKPVSGKVKAPAPQKHQKQEEGEPEAPKPSSFGNSDGYAWLFEAIENLAGQKADAKAAAWPMTAENYKNITIRIPVGLYRDIMLHKIDSGHSANTMFLVGAALYISKAAEVDAVIKEVEKQTGKRLDRYETKS